MIAAPLASQPARPTDGVELCALGSARSSMSSSPRGLPPEIGHSRAERRAASQRASASVVADSAAGWSASICFSVRHAPEILAMSASTIDRTHRFFERNAIRFRVHFERSGYAREPRCFPVRLFSNTQEDLCRACVSSLPQHVR